MADERVIFCANCKCKQRFMKRCSACGQVFYCSKECQVKHWQYHRSNCQEFRKDNTELTKTNCFEVSSKSNLCDVSSSRCSENPSVILKSSFPEVDGYKSTGVSQQDEIKEHFYSATWTGTISNCEVQNKKDKEETCVCSQQGITMNQVSQSSLQELDKSENTLIRKGVTIIIKHNRVRHELSIPPTENGDAILQMISDCVSIPVSKLKLIHKGKMATSVNIQSMLFNKALFLAFGEISESEEGLEKEDIDLIIKQLGVDRNLAVKVLRKNGNVVDAIIEIGNI